MLRATGMSALLAALAALLLAAPAGAASVRLKLSEPPDTAAVIGSGLQLHVAIRGAVRAGAKLQLRSGSSKLAVSRRGSTASVTVTSQKPSAVTYQVVLLSGRGGVLARSNSLAVTWGVPGGYFTLDVSGGPGGVSSAELNPLIDTTSCSIYGCDTGANDGDGLTLTGHTGSDEETPADWATLPPHWSISLTVDGVPVICVPNSPETLCSGTYLVPSGEGQLSVTATLTAPDGKTFDVSQTVGYSPVQEL